MAVWAGLVAALLYCSWPLGYIFDPQVERYSLASELQALHHPYNWLFIVTDVLAGVLLLGVSVWLFGQAKSGWQKLAVGTLAGFGLLVALAALTPLSCDPATKACGPLIDNSAVLVHGFASIVSVVLLFVSLVAVHFSLKKVSASQTLRASVLVLLFGWLLFAVGSILEIISHAQGNTLQDYFITICSISIVAVVSALALYVKPTA